MVKFSIYLCKSHNLAVLCHRKSTKLRQNLPKLSLRKSREFLIQHAMVIQHRFSEMQPPTHCFEICLFPEGVCTDEFLSRKPSFLLSAMHSHPFCWFSAAPLVFLFLGLLPLQLYQIWRIFCVMYGEECGWTLFLWLQKLYLTEMFEWLLSCILL